VAQLCKLIHLYVIVKGKDYGQYCEDLTSDLTTCTAVREVHSPQITEKWAVRRKVPPSSLSLDVGMTWFLMVAFKLLFPKLK
jgi:hypothetical protein